jgi:copper chaperone CopZ
MVGAAAMSLSSVCVVTNALRLNGCDVYATAKDRKRKIRQRKEGNTMQKTMKIEGMMCPHCEARVKKLLEETKGVTSAVVSHTDGTAVVTMDAPIADETLIHLITENGYRVIDIQQTSKTAQRRAERSWGIRLYVGVWGRWINVNIVLILLTTTRPKNMCAMRCWGLTRTIWLDYRTPVIMRVRCFGFTTNTNWYKNKTERSVRSAQFFC